MIFFPLGLPNILLAATSLLLWVVIIPGMVSVWRLAGPSPSLSTPTRSFQSKFPREQTPTTTNPSRGLKWKMFAEEKLLQNVSNKMKLN